MCKPTTTADGRTVYKCPFCSKDFLSFSDINRHMDFHEGKRKGNRKYRYKYIGDGSLHGIYMYFFFNSFILEAVSVVQIRKNWHNTQEPLNNMVCYCSVSDTTCCIQTKMYRLYRKMAINGYFSV